MMGSEARELRRGSPLPTNMLDASLAQNVTAERHHTACYRCRSARQKCNRLDPCSRCVSRSQTCSYPSVSHRGRRIGSANKPDTVEKLLLRISESQVGDQVVKAILDSAAAASPSGSTIHPASSSSGFRVSSSTRTNNSTEDPPSSSSLYHTRTSHAPTSTITVSPLDILAAAVSAVSSENETNGQYETGGLPFQPSSRTTAVSAPAGQAPVDLQFLRHFVPQSSIQSDWQALAGQPVESTFKLDSGACDPVAARLIDDTDTYYLFDLFFTIRNPLLGLLDPDIHTPDYVYSTSFTLFSAICAAGCAVSSRPRDRVIYAALLSLAEGNVKWSIAVSVRSLEFIQATIIMQYWAPICSQRSSDPFWLHLSHAAQVARELGIDDPIRIDKYLALSAPNATDDLKQRFRRNYERTWLYIFIADKSFGIVNGRRLGVAWNEMPANVFDWWQAPAASCHDRMISGIMKTRWILANAIEERIEEDGRVLPIPAWHSKWFKMLEHLRETSCALDFSPSGKYLPVLAFYMDHNILVLSAQALRDMGTAGDQDSTELKAIHYKTAQVATRSLDTVLSDPLVKELRLGFHNNMFIMICHAVAEVVQAFKKNTLPVDEASETITKIRAVPEHLDKIAQQLPTTSRAKLYAKVCKILVLQLDKIAEPASEQQESIVSRLSPAAEAWWPWGYLPFGGVEGSSAIDPMMLDLGFPVDVDNNNTGLPW